MSFFRTPLLDWLLFLAFAASRLILSQLHGLGVDEAHYALYGAKLDLSYFDHPPLIGWVESPFLFFFGRQEWAVRLPAILCGVISSALVYRLCLRLSTEPSRARWAALALNGSFLVSGLWLMFLPDSLLLVLVLFLIFTVLNILTLNRRRDWVLFGLCLGLCGLTKYTAILFIPALLGFSLSTGQWRKIFSVNGLMAVIVAALTIAPVIIWNIQHDWISFKYQTNHVLGQGQQSWAHLAQFLVTQLVAYNPLLIIMTLTGLLARFGRRSHPWPDPADPTLIQLILWLALPQILFFTFSSLKEVALPHWTFVGWALLIPLAVLLLPPSRRWWRGVIAISLGLNLFLMLEFAVGIFQFQPYQSPYADLVGWRELHDEIALILKTTSSKSEISIGVTNWTLGSRAHFYLEDLAPIVVLDNRFDQFDLWEKPAPHGAKILLLEWHGFEAETTGFHCLERQAIKEILFKAKQQVANSVRLSWCSTESSE
jgi:4-amino-4-deoxy-L-arabinose transferase-like glycosyltransferase